MKQRRLLLFCPGVIALVAASGLGCGGGSIGDSPDAAVCPGGQQPITAYLDTDNDGYGDPNQPVTTCGDMGTAVANNLDCNDGRDAINPDGVEICGDKLDNDCAGGDPCALSLLAHWHLHDSIGYAAEDISGNNHEGELLNGPEWTADGGFFLRFNGDGGYVEVPHRPDFLVDEGTISLWFRVFNTNVVHGIWSKDSSGLDTGGHLSISTLAETVDPNTGDVTSPAVIRVRLQHSDITVGNEGSNTVFSPGIEADTWYHVVFVFGPEGMRLHVNNTLVDASPYTGGLGSSAGSIGNQEPIVMGAGAWGSDNLSATPISGPHNGDLSDVRFYNRALTASEISDLNEVSGYYP